MSGPTESSEGRAVKANHEPSGENAADSPTILTLDAIARDAAIVGSGVTLGVAVGSAEAVGLADGVAAGLALGVSLGTSLGGGAVVAAVSVGVAVGSVDGVAVAGVGVTAGDGLGVAPVLGSEITTTASLPLSSVPITTAWLLPGERLTDLGVIEMLTWL